MGIGRLGVFQTYAHLRHHHIRNYAYQKWEEAGRPDGDGVEFWLAAEVELTERCRRLNAGEEL
jgi:hypothetical protein